MNVVVVVDSGSRAYDVATALEVFEDRTRFGLPATSIELAAATELVDLGEVVLRRRRQLDQVDQADLVVVPGRSDPEAQPDPDVIDVVRTVVSRGLTVAGLCTGAFVLGAAGVLDGQPATTHWRWCTRLAERFPRVRVVPNVLYAGADGVWTSAGVSAGADLLLELLRARHGAAVAADVARSMVTPAHRPGTQAQFIPPARSASPGDLEQLQQAILRDVSRPWSLTDMARLAGLSTRTLSRRFLAEAGTTPASWLVDVRLAAAQELLETTSLGVEAVAHATGFGSADLLRKHFRARYGSSPQAHRRAMTSGSGPSA